MSEKTEKRRADLRSKVIDAAEARIIADGPTMVKARDLAKEVGCAVGALYNVFSDMTDVVLAVNGRTFARLGQHIKDALTETPNAPAPDQIMTMARAYLDFAINNTNAWSCLFDFELPKDKEIPDWYRDELQGLFGLIAAPLTQLHPTTSFADLSLLTQGLFSAVHGVVRLGLEGRTAAVTPKEIETMLTMVLRPHLRL